MKEFEITGMTCGGCVRRVIQSVEQVEGVHDAQASVETKILKVQGNVDAEAVIQAVENAGYQASIK